MSTNIECRDYRQYEGNGTCWFMMNTPDCQMDGGFIDYLTFIFCTIGDKYLGLGLALLAGWLAVLFVGLGVTADAYFCPALRVIAKILGLSENIAGVTFLAFGNGAPDIFSAIAAVGSATGGDVGLAFGALFGAGVFVTTVVAGTICLTKPFRSIQRPLLRDIIFFIVASFGAYFAMYDGVINFAESLGFVIMYIVYLIVVLGGYFINRRMKDRRALLQAAQTEVAHKHYGAIQDANENIEEAEVESLIVPDDTYAQQDISYALYLRHAFLPRNDEPWAERGIINKIFFVVKLPVLLVLHFTVPLVDYEKPEDNWHKLLNSFHLVSAPLTVCFLIDVGFNKINGFFPVWAVVLIVSTPFCFASIILTEFHTKPRFHSLYAFVGFGVSVVWIYCIANEIVNLLQTFGVIFDISNTILGLTFLAWGNSLSDYVSNVVSARQGYPNMGISACYGGPLLNFLMGLGIPFTLATIKNGTPYVINTSILQNVIAYFLFGSLVVTIIFIPLNKFFYSRGFGGFLIVYYVAFLVMAILIETNVIS